MEASDIQNEIVIFSEIINHDNNIKTSSPSDVYVNMCNMFNIFPDSSRLKDFVFIRQLSHTISKFLSDRGDFYATLSEIGHEIDNRDHSTVNNSIKTMNNYVSVGYRYNDINSAMSLFGLSMDLFGYKPRRILKVSVSRDGTEKTFNTLKEASVFLKCNYRNLSGYIESGYKVNGYNVKFKK